MSSFVKPAYRADIDGLRALAVLSVVGFHAWPQWFKSGFIGVDIFFVISGYLISKIIFDNLSRGSFSFTEFYSRRIRRIFPALILVLATAYALGWAAFYPDEMMRLAKHIASGAGFFSNFVFLNESGYFDGAAITKPLLHLWSLGIEEQFYLVWPPILVFFWKKNINWGGIIPLLILVSFLFNVVKAYPEPMLAFYSPCSRFWELWVGAALALVAVKNKNIFSEKILNCLSLVGLTLIVLAFLLLDKHVLFPGFWALLPVIGSAFIIAGGRESYINRKILANPLLVNIGLISFPLYLWHWLLISFVEVITNYAGSVNAHLVAVLISFVLAWLTYQFIEKPIRRGFDSRAVVGALMVSNICIGAIGAVIYYQYQVENELREASIPEMAIARIENTNGYKVLLMGDSHAHHLLHGLKKSFGENIIDSSTGGCLPLINIDVYNKLYPSGKCLITSNRAMGFLHSEQSIDRIVMSNMGPVYLTGEAFKVKIDTRVDGMHVEYTPNRELRDRWLVYELALRDTLTKIASYNKKVIFVLDIPEIGASPKNCQQGKIIKLFGHSFATRQATINNCFVSRQEFEGRIARYKNLVKFVLKDFPQVSLFDPTNLFCDQQVCSWSKNGRALYSDADHLSKYGSEYLAQYLAPVIARQ